MKYEEEYQLKKQKLWRPLTVGLTAMMLAAPVYAEEIQTPAMGADTSVTQTAPSSHQEENKLAPYIGLLARPLPSRLLRVMLLCLRLKLPLL